MDSITQGLLGAAVAQLALQSRIGPRAWLYGAVGGMAPDLDMLIRSSTDPLVGLTYHRHFTHSLSFIPLGGPLAALPWIARRRHWPQWRAIVGATTVGYATHALLDAFTTYGTQLFWPWSDLRVAWSWLAIVDPLFSVPLAVGVVLAARRRGVRPVAWALAFCAAYALAGGLQQRRAVGAARELARARGHADLERIDAFPNTFSNLVWRTAYLHEGTIHVDWVRTPWWSAAQPHAGSSTPRATEATLPPAIAADPRALRAFRVFDWFTNGWTSPAPEGFGDQRYGASLGSATSMWTLGVSPGTAEPFTFERSMGSFGERIDAMLGR